MAKDRSKPDPIPESDKGIELDHNERRQGDDQSQAGQKRGGGSEPPPRADPGSAKEGLDGQNRDKRNGEGLGRI
jgi:hypothetical protein